jgi:hypothetical protein
VTDTIEGVTAVLYTPMADRAIQFGEPSLFPLVDGAEIRWRRARVGMVEAVWQDGDRVLWRGRLDEPAWPDVTADSSPRIPFLEPDARPYIEARQLIGLPAVVQARTETRGGCMLVRDWTVAGMELLGAAVAPWPGMELHFTQA